MGIRAWWKERKAVKARRKAYLEADSFTSRPKARPQFFDDGGMLNLENNSHRTPDDYSGHGGEFGGAGASGSWDTASSDHSSSYGSSSYDSSSSCDSGSSDSGSCDSGSGGSD